MAFLVGISCVLENNVDSAAVGSIKINQVKGFDVLV